MVVAEVTRSLSPDLTAAVRPELAGRAIEAELHRCRADREVRADLSDRQQELWSWLRGLPISVTLDVPADLREVDPIAVRRVSAERRREEAGTAAEALAARDASLTALRAGQQATTERVRELEAEVAGLRELTAEIARLREVETHAVQLGEDLERLEHARQSTEQSLTTVYSSRSWRLTQPLRRAGGLIRGRAPRRPRVRQ